MNDDLKDTLLALLESHTPSNPALNTLLSDYTNYHLVLVVPGAGMVLVLLALNGFFLYRFRRTPRYESHAWTFEKKTFFSFWVVCTLASLMMALIVAANVSNVLDARHGLSLLAESLSTPSAGSNRATLLQAFDTWLRSEDTDIPPTVQRALNNRLSWQQPKAIVCSLLLVCFTLLNTWIWRSLLKRSRANDGTWIAKDMALLTSGIGTVATAMLMMVMALANLQAVWAPITLTLQFS